MIDTPPPTPPAIICPAGPDAVQSACEKAILERAGQGKYGGDKGHQIVTLILKASISASTGPNGENIATIFPNSASWEAIDEANQGVQDAVRFQRAILIDGHGPGELKGYDDAFADEKLRAGVLLVVVFNETAKPAPCIDLGKGKYTEDGHGIQLSISGDQAKELTLPRNNCALVFLPTFGLSAP